MITNKVLTCQHCGHKHYSRHHVGLAWAPCPKCGRQTQTRSDEHTEPPGRMIENPARYM